MKVSVLPTPVWTAFAPFCVLLLLPLATVQAEFVKPRLEKQPQRRLLPGLSKPPATEYNYIVVGAGTTGLTLAARLSEDPSVTVAVLEAGIDYKSNLLNQQLTTIPGADVIGAGASANDLPQNLIDWSFTAPQGGAAQRKVHFARGKCLGGSSSRNFMVLQRPSKQSHQEWVQLTGNSSWSFDARFDDYRKTFGITPSHADLRRDIPAAQYERNAFADGAGPVQVSFPNYAQPFSESLSGSLNEIGVKTIQGHNKGDINGATAKKVLFDTSDGKPRARNVTFEYRSGLFGVIVGEQATLTARKEAILCAGAFQSPQLLVLSGIGPKDELAKHDIATLVESSNVGQNMQDHIFFGPSYPVKVETLTKLASDPIYLAAQYANFSVAQLGPLTNNVADMIAFERFSNAELDSIGAGVLTSYPQDWPTVEYLSAPGYGGNFDNLFLQTAPLRIKGNFATILVALVSPQSRGSVTLQSNDFKDLPIIDPRWLTDAVDQKVAIAAFKRARTLFASKAMSPIINGPEYEPGLDKVKTDDEILAWIQSNLMTVSHPASTARMGKSIDRAVVDSQFRVFGVDGLRVVDASSFASLLPGHPQSVCYMIAERAATLILAAK